MKKSKSGVILIESVCISLFFAACNLSDNTERNDENFADTTKDNEKIFQYSTIQALTAGDYDGSLQIDELLKHGDIGLGTFDELNGEMTVLDGVCYQTLYDGSVIKTNADETTPFACVTFFDNDTSSSLKGITNIEEVKNELNKLIDSQNRNVFYVAKISGEFATMHVRSELSQEKPYKTLDEVMKTDQREFNYERIKGTIVALYCPNYVGGVNATGWHLHFISEDRSKGGHILGLSFDTATVEIDKTDEFNMQLPNTESFKQLHLDEVSEDAINKVEKGSNTK